MSESRHGDEFRAPGELRDDFFDTTEEGSDGMSALTAYARLDPNVSSNSAAAATTPAAHTLSAYSMPRRMEGFGGGGGRGEAGGLYMAQPPLVQKKPR